MTSARAVSLTVLSIVAIAVGAQAAGTTLQAGAEPVTDVAAAPLQPGEQRTVKYHSIRYMGAERDAKPKLDKATFKNKYKANRDDKSATDDQIELVRYSDDVYGDIQGDGTVKLKYQRALAYTVRTNDEEVPFYGGMDMPYPSNYPLICDFVEVFDADSAALMGAHFECP